MDDLIEGIHKLFLSNYVYPVNIGNPVEMTIKQMADKIVQLTQSKSSFVFKPLPVDDPKVRQPDIHLAKKILSWEPKITLEEGLKRSLDYFKRRILV